MAKKGRCRRPRSLFRGRLPSPGGIGCRPGTGAAWLLAIPLAAVVIYAFIPILANGFVAWDDDKALVENPYFRGLGVAQVKWAWTTFRNGSYFPLTWLFFGTEYVLWQLDPRGYHLTSLLLQVANAVVLYVLTVALLLRCRIASCLESPWTCSCSAALATALFAVHPLRVEIVAWATVQSYLLCALFSMLAVLAYLRAFPLDSSPRWGWLAGSFLLFVAALLFHAPAVTLPAVLLILDVYPLRRFPDETGRWFGAAARRALLEKIPFAITSLVFMGLVTAAKPESRFAFQHEDGSEVIARACYAIWFYIRKTVLPLDLTIVYPIPKDLNWLAFPYSLSILATLTISAALLLLRRRWPGLLAVWLCYLVILAPNLGFVRTSDGIAADRYSYMSMLGLVMVAAACFCWIWHMLSRWRPGAIGVIAIGLGALLGLTALTRNQCQTWLNSETLWAHALTHGGNSNAGAHNSLGIALQAKGSDQAAEAQFTEALRLKPDYIDAHNNLGLLLDKRGNYQAAVAQMTEAVRLDPGSASAQRNLGTVLFRHGKYQEAVAHLALAIRLDPNDDKAHDNLGFVYFTQGKYEKATAHFAEALRLNPSSAAAHNNLGLVLFAQGKNEEAEAHLALAAWLNPDDAQVHNNLGKVLSRHGKHEAAEAHYTAAVRLNPAFAEAHNNLGLALQTKGSYQAAEGHFSQALRLDPGLANAHYNLGISLVVRGGYEAAAAHFAEALRLDPGFADAHYNLGVVLFSLGNYGPARAHFAEAVRLKPGDPDAYNASAMLMAACPEAKLRDGKGAVQFATRACELTQWKNPSCLNTLAAAQAEAGDFGAAVKAQHRAIELLTDQGQKAEYRSRLVLYQAMKPYRQVSPQPAPSRARP